MQTVRPRPPPPPVLPHLDHKKKESGQEVVTEVLGSYRQRDAGRQQQRGDVHAQRGQQHDAGSQQGKYLAASDHCRREPRVQCTLQASRGGVGALWGRALGGAIDPMCRLSDTH